MLGGMTSVVNCAVSLLVHACGEPVVADKKR